MVVDSTLPQGRRTVVSKLPLDDRLLQEEGTPVGIRAVEEIEIGEEGRIMHLKGYGMVKVFRIVTDFDEADHWATNDLTMTEAQRQELARQAFAIENYHQALKQCCAVEKCQARSAVAQKNHILFSLRAFVQLEVARLRTGKSCYETKLSIIREAVRSFCRSGGLLRATTA